MDASSLCSGSNTTNAISFSNPLSLAYGGILLHIRVELLNGRNDNGWQTRHGEARDWPQSASKSWGAVEGERTSPHANIHPDFDYIGLSWSGQSDHDTSFDNLDTEDWAPLQSKSPVIQSTAHMIHLP